MGHVACMGGRATHAGLLWGNLKNREYLQNLGVNGRIILQRILKQWGEKISKINLAQDKNTWWVLGNRVMKFLVSYKVEPFLSCTQEGLYSL